MPSVRPIETFRELVRVINLLVSQFQAADIGSQLEPLNRLIGKLWPAFLGQRGNSLFWATRSALANPAQGKCDLVGILLSDHWPGTGVPAPQTAYQRLFSAVLDETEMSQLVRDEDKALVLAAFSATEDIRHSLSLYHAEFQHSLSALDDLVSCIQGECYRLMSADADYVKAYLLHHLIRKILLADPKDPITNCWLRNALHTQLQPIQLEQLYGLWQKYQYNLSHRHRQRLTTQLTGWHWKSTKKNKHAT